jgi:aspartyl-tRNA(Asn)/glutamyl-tRNA(Gln) amidotransferase subunit C
MAITREEVAYTAKLARLELSEDELERLGADLARISAYVDQLAEVRESASDIDPVLPLIPNAVALRDDVIQPSLSRDAALSGAPDADDGFFKVPKVIG